MKNLLLSLTALLSLPAFAVHDNVRPRSGDEIQFTKDVTFANELMYSPKTVQVDGRVVTVKRENVRYKIKCSLALPHVAPNSKVHVRAGRSLKVDLVRSSVVLDHGVTITCHHQDAEEYWKLLEASWDLDYREVELSLPMMKWMRQAAPAPSEREL